MWPETCQVFELGSEYILTSLTFQMPVLAEAENGQHESSGAGRLTGLPIAILYKVGAETSQQYFA